MTKRITTCCHCGSEVTTTQESGPIECRTCRHAMKRAGIRACIYCKAPFKWTKSARCPKCKHGVDRVNEPTYEKNCTFCVKTFTTQDNRTVYCSRQCAAWNRAGFSNSTEIVHVPRPTHERGTPKPHEIPARKGPPLSAGPCGWCGTLFVGPPFARYCAKTCAANASWKRKYDLRGDFNPTPRLRKFICERDGWTCQICGEAVDPDAKYLDKGYATLDHIIPQSLQLIPDHSASNLRLAHMVCNARRGNRMEDLALTA